MSQQLDTQRLAQMIKSKRGAKGLRQAALEIGDISLATLSRVEQGKVPDVETFIKIAKWLEVSTDYFISENTPDITIANQDSNKDVIVAHLRADKILKPEVSEALIQFIQIAYNSTSDNEENKT